MAGLNLPTYLKGNDTVNKTQESTKGQENSDNHDSGQLDE
jgi:hypothetical protein